MKKFFILITGCLFLNCSLFGQDRNSHAVALYIQADDDNNESRFEECVANLNKSIQLLGEANEKILYLKIRCLENIYKQSFEHTFDLDTSLRTFFAKVEKEKYPAEKYLDMIRIRRLVDDFKKSDQAFYDKIVKDYNSNKPDHQTIIEKSKAYVINTKNSYYKNELDSISEQSQQIIDNNVRIVQKKSVMRDLGTTLLTIGGSMGLGNHAQTFKDPATSADINQIFDGTNYALGSKFTVHANILNVPFPVHTSPTSRLSINWTLLDLGFFFWNWQTNTKLYPTGESSTNDIKNLFRGRMGTKVGPAFAFSGKKTNNLFEIYYTIRPGYFIGEEDISYLLGNNSSSTEYTVTRAKFKINDIELGHEVGFRLIFNRIILNPFVQLGTFNQRTITTVSGNTTPLERKMKHPYTFAGISLGFLGKQ